MPRPFRSNLPRQTHLPLFIAVLFLAWPLVTGGEAPWWLGWGLVWFGAVAALAGGFGLEGRRGSGAGIKASNPGGGCKGGRACDQQRAREREEVLVCLAADQSPPRR